MSLQACSMPACQSTLHFFAGGGLDAKSTPFWMEAASSAFIKSKFSRSTAFMGGSGRNSGVQVRRGRGLMPDRVQWVAGHGPAATRLVVPHA